MIEMKTHSRSERCIPLVVMVLARTTIFMNNWVNKLVAYVAVCVGPASAIPLLEFRL